MDHHLDRQKADGEDIAECIVGSVRVEQCSMSTRDGRLTAEDRCEPRPDDRQHRRG